MAYFDLDSELIALESEWRLAYEASREARSHVERFESGGAAAADLLLSLREKLDQADESREKIMLKIERLETRMLRWLC